ncbi:putative GNAT family N-acyltransferase [Natranaerovirga pectinivora]|uniref:Putative GNAT family N-acyltransferase n=1 Tax=Natranaerovirga pectinivora TaxID=682400 RepID=A0A4R3MMX3_9FIRM|nr:GNAT family N-acetyltransferase [Natranaerovirga pectinivora]TCT15615.1 putative GNAT family N-acyltransferase [Natranaerovirga pectinivora]
MIAKPITNQDELEIAFKIRKKVFVEEQGVPAENEFDEYEATTTHVLAYYNNEAVGAGRLRTIDDIAKLERICVLESHRKYGIGRTIVHCLENLAKEKGIKKSKLHGQTHALSFYEKLGYIKASEEFLEEGIPHLVMIKELS